MRLSMAVGFWVPAGMGRAVPTPAQAVFVRYEYCKPNCRRPFGPLYGLYQKPNVPSMMFLVSAEQPEGLKPVLKAVPGTASVPQARLLRSTAPYPMTGFPNDDWPVKGLM